MSNFHLQEIQTLQNSLREREKYISQLENRLRALWDKYDRERAHYMDRIKRLEEAGDNLLTVMRGEEAAAYCEWIALAHDAELNWRKAKEAKP